MTLTIKSNGIARATVDAYELTPEERKQFDYLNWEAIDKGEDSATFFRYRGGLYDLGEFMRCEEDGHFAKLGWDGYASDTMFSCLLVRFRRNGDYVVIGRAYS